MPGTVKSKAFRETGELRFMNMLTCPLPSWAQVCELFKKRSVPQDLQRRHKPHTRVCIWSRLGSQPFIRGRAVTGRGAGGKGNRDASRASGLQDPSWVPSPSLRPEQLETAQKVKCLGEIFPGSSPARLRTQLRPGPAGGGGGGGSVPGCLEGPVLPRCWGSLGRLWTFLSELLWLRPVCLPGPHLLLVNPAQPQR